MSVPVNVVCATPPSPNPGMGSVDLAFQGLWRRYFPSAEVRFLQLFTTEEQHPHGEGRERSEYAAREVMPFEYAAFRDRLPELYGGGAIVFWGDFLHMFHYRDEIARRLQLLGMASDVAAGRAVVDRHFFLAEAPAGVLGKTLAFGGNLLFNRASNCLEADYERVLKRFVLQAKGVWMRDVFSALLVSRLRQDWTRSHLGVDCALLLEKESVEAIPRRWSGRPPAPDGCGVAGIFFSRNVLPRRLMLSFARTICRQRGVRAQWLPWRRVKFPKWPSLWAFPELERLLQDEPPSLGDLLDLIADCEFVITDTYHVCVNAWRLGKPAVCIGETWTEREMDVSCGPVGAWSDKRWVFYAMNGALEFYIHAAELRHRSWRDRRAAGTAALLQDHGLVHWVQAGIQSRAEAARRELLDELLPLIR